MQDRRSGAAWILAFTAVLLVLLWARTLNPLQLALAATAVIGAAIAGGRRFLALDSGAERWLAAALALLLLAVAAGGFAARRFSQIEFDWERLLAERSATHASLLERSMRAVVERGRSAVELGVGVVDHDRWTLFRQLDEIRGRTGVDALAVFGENGELIAWAGEHRGQLPARARFGVPGISFSEGPLFSYLYFSSAPGGRGRHIVAAMLLESGITRDDANGRAVATVFAARTAERAVFRRGGAPDAAWSLVVDHDTVVHARFDRVGQAEWRAQVARTARQAATLLGLLALGCIVAGWLSASRQRTQLTGSAPLAAFAIALAVAPLGAAFGLGQLFSPLYFLLPGPGDITLGTTLALLLPLAALVAGLRPPVLGRRAFAGALVFGSLAVAFGFAAVLRIARDAAAPPLLEGGAGLWLGLQLAATLALALLAGLALPRHGRAVLGRGRARRPLAPVFLAAGLLVSTGLGLLRAAATPPSWAVADAFAALWAIPFVCLALAFASYGGLAGGYARWLAAGWLASTAVLPNLWDAHVRARLDAAERELATLGTRPDVYLDYLLYEFGREARLRYQGGEDSVLLLYRTWVASGLAREPYSARILLWSGEGTIDYELTLGTAPEPDPYLGAVQRLVLRTGAEVEPRVIPTFDLPDVNRILLVPLPDGRTITVVVPPRRTLAAPTAVAPFLGGGAPPDARLTLVPSRTPVQPAEHVFWTRSAAGWRSETIVRYSDGDYHAHLELRLMSFGVRLARATLLITLNLLVLSGLWMAGSALRGMPPVPRGGWRALLGTFRTRITLALFAFFLVPTALFGWVAYGALAGEVTRAARIVAERAVSLAVVEFPQVGGALRELAAHAGSEVLYYYYGELAAVSSPETLDLGVYDAWMPPHVFRALQTSEETSAVEMHRLGRQEFVTAYHSLLPAGTLAVPMALTAGDTTLRQRELAHLVIFAVLIGALLSFALSIVVGRALAGPLGRVRRAAAAIGAGNLKVRLPEREGDEFGELFASFNRMVRRLRRARARELRTERVLAWGEMARQIAHEIKNPLTPIKLSVQHLRRARADRREDFDEILETSVTEILREIDRLSEIARAFSRYGAPPLLAGPLDRVDVGTVVREALTLYRAGEPRVRYLDALASDLPLVRARADELKEVILNLLENARVALGDEGTVTVAAQALDGVVEIEVRDDGPGIPPDLLPRIFEPTFSTRLSGAGLGLPIVRRLVESWGGTVAAESAPEGGATLRVRIPLA